MKSKFSDKLVDKSTFDKENIFREGCELLFGKFKTIIDQKIEKLSCKKPEKRDTIDMEKFINY